MVQYPCHRPSPSPLPSYFQFLRIYMALQQQDLGMSTLIPAIRYWIFSSPRSKFMAELFEHHVGEDAEYDCTYLLIYSV